MSMIADFEDFFATVVFLLRPNQKSPLLTAYQLRR